MISYLIRLTVYQLNVQCQRKQRFLTFLACIELSLLKSEKRYSKDVSIIIVFIIIITQLVKRHMLIKIN